MIPYPKEVRRMRVLYDLRLAGAEYDGKCFTVWPTWAAEGFLEMFDKHNRRHRPIHAKIF